MKRNLILRRRRSGDTILKLEEKKPERPCKPSFVPAMLLASGEHSSRALVTQKPHQRADPRALDGQSISLEGNALLLALAPGGVCRASQVTLTAVRSYRAVSPLPAEENSGRFIFCGTFLRIAPTGR